jgi:6-phosphogluconolactonase
MKYNLKNKKDVILKLDKILKSKNSIIISGGSTIKDTLKNYKYKILCKKILLSDERLVKNYSKLRNDLFFRNLIKKNILKPEQLISYTLDYLDKKKVNSISNKINQIKFDYAILGLGNNGHFASIFETNSSSKDFYFINNSPKFPKKRVTVSLEKINKCKKIFFVASRKKKNNEIANFYKYKLIQKLQNKKIILLTY